MSNLYVATDALVVDAVESNVGINTSTPLRNLDVNGDARIQSTTDTAVKTWGCTGGIGWYGRSWKYPLHKCLSPQPMSVWEQMQLQPPLHVMGTDIGDGI